MPHELRDRLAARIRGSGPLTVEAFMAACLDDEQGGYYRTREPIGEWGDFITAPEISQMFGELIGLWCVTVWDSMGRPAPFNLVELGPGRGTLMADALRAARLRPAFLCAARITLVEINPLLRARQAETLTAFAGKLSWCDRLAEAPDGATIVIGNEFLDALPVRHLIRQGGVWRERCVGADEDGKFVFVSGLECEPPADFDRLGEAGEGATLELRPAADAVLEELAGRAAKEPLAALLVDYGHVETAFGETLQAVREHRPADPLADPGKADLTAHVDFAALARNASDRGLSVHGPIPQGIFLLGLGLAERCTRLMLEATPEAAEIVAAEARRLVDASAMGELFKAIAITSAGLPALAPFAIEAANGQAASGQAAA